MARVAVAEAFTFRWERYTGFDGAIPGLCAFGLSLPTKVVEQYFGFKSAHVVAAAKVQITRQEMAHPSMDRRYSQSKGGLRHVRPAQKTSKKFMLRASMELIIYIAF